MAAMTSVAGTPRSSVSSLARSLAWLLSVFALLVSSASIAYWVYNLFNIWVPEVGPVWRGLPSLSLGLLLVLLTAALVSIGVAILMAWIKSLNRSGPWGTGAALNTFSLYLACSFFWVLVLVGAVELLLALPEIFGAQLRAFVGEDLGGDLIKKEFRGAVVHLPLVFLGFVLGLFTRGPNFIWLGLMIVLAELTSAIFANVFRLTNVHIGDLVRMWYVGLFMLSAAYTLAEGGHVRVDVLYAGLSQRAKNWVNLLGCFVFGLPLAAIILLISTGSERAVVNGALRIFDRGPNGAGLLTQYFLAFIFMTMACILIVQFMSYAVTHAARLLGHDPEPDAS